MPMTSVMEQDYFEECGLSGALVPAWLLNVITSTLIMESNWEPVEFL